MKTNEKNFRKNISKGCEYFPKLFPTLLKLIHNPDLILKAKTHRSYKRKLQSMSNLLTILSVYIDKEYPIIEAFDYIEECISDKELMKKDFYKFANGYLYDANFDESTFYYTLEDESSQLLSDYKFIEEHSQSGIKQQEFAKHVYDLLSKLYKNFNPDAPSVTSREYAEFCFLDLVKNECENIKDIVTFDEFKA